MVANQAHDDTPAGAAGHAARGSERHPPMALRIGLGAQLRRLREASQISREQAADAIRATHSKISRLERGRSGARQRDVADLLTLYGVSDEAEREALMALTRQASAPGWWQQYSDILPRWLELYIGLEEAASVIRSYEMQFVHGLLQTEDYARAVILIANARATAEEIERRVSMRMKRQQLVTQPGAPKLRAVLDEAALYRPLGDRQVMRAQLERLLEVVDLPNVSFQIMPFEAGPHAAAGGPFTILRFPEPDLADVVYLEQLHSALYLDQPGDVATYVTVMEQLSAQAQTPEATRDHLSRLLKDT